MGAEKKERWRGSIKEKMTRKGGKVCKRKKGGDRENIGKSNKCDKTILVYF